ncbi:hypothetical protein F2Q69_00023488 [Brassica cretica]|uniref:Uncharacterized protein n=1 Tax=Brassica cretica TaxID=69181 RepID=A0A8S9Q5T6_BRACR|nr:hypothetical protein F2Q69_00023488 [Brassica cretica]
MLVPNLQGKFWCQKGGSSEIAVEVRKDEPPQKKKKKDKKKKPAEKDPVPSVGAENRELVVHEESSCGNAASPSGPSVDRVIEKAETEHSRLLAEKKAQKAKFTEKFGELKGKSRLLARRLESAVPLIEGSTAPPALPSSDPGSAPLGASSMVDEEAPAREVGTGDADPVLPAEGRETRPCLDDLVELSDSSIERSGQNESSDGAPPEVGED